MQNMFKDKLSEISYEKYGKSIGALDKQELYGLIGEFVNEKCCSHKKDEDSKRVAYFSIEYLIGKLLQTTLSLILSVIMQSFLFSPADRLHISVIGMLFPVLFCIVIIAFYRKIEKKSSIPAMVGV